MTDENTETNVDPFEMSREEIKEYNAGNADGVLSEMYNAAFPDAPDAPDKQEQTSDPTGETKKKEAPGPEKTTEDRIAELERRLEEKENFIKRQAEEVGGTRKQMAALEAESALPNLDADMLRELFEDDPQEAVNRILAAREEREAKQQADLESMREANRNYISQKIENAEEYRDEALRLIKEEDKAEEDSVKAIASDFDALPAVLQLNLLHRARQSISLREKEQQITELQGELEKYRTGQRSAVKGIREAIEKRRPAASGLNLPTAPARKDDVDVDVWSMSRDELQAWKKRNSDQSRAAIQQLLGED